MPQAHLDVRLLAHTPDPLALVYAAFRQCYHAGYVADMWPKLLAGEISREKQAEFVAEVTASGHVSPIEHVSFTFAVEGVSRALTHQLVRHRIASYSQQSQRYVDASNFDYVLPPAIAANPKALARFEAFMGEVGQAYRDLKELLEARRTRGHSQRGRPFRFAPGCPDPHRGEHELPHAPEFFRAALLHAGSVGDSGHGPAHARPVPRGAARGVRPGRSQVRAAGILPGRKVQLRQIPGARLTGPGASRFVKVQPLREVAMKIQGTIIELEDEVFAVFVVNETVLRDPAACEAKLAELEPFFPEVPVVFISPDSAGGAIFHGRDDLVDTIRDRPFFGFLWREYVLE